MQRLVDEVAAVGAFYTEARERGLTTFSADVLSTKSRKTLRLTILVSRLEAAPWAKAAGYGWVALDVLAGILMINEVAYDTAWAVRLGGHVLAGVWIVSSSLVSRAWPVTVVGVITGLWLAGYSFVGNVLPESFLRPAGILILVWFALLAIFHRPAEGRAATLSGLPRPATSPPSSRESADGFSGDRH